jgi:hypothetical protein
MRGARRKEMLVLQKKEQNRKYNVPNTFLQDPSRNVQGNPFDFRILGSVYNKKG